MMQGGLELRYMLAKDSILLHHIPHVSNRMEDGSMRTASHAIAYLREGAVGELLAEIDSDVSRLRYLFGPILRQDGLGRHVVMLGNRVDNIFDGGGLRLERNNMTDYLFGKGEVDLLVR